MTNILKRHASLMGAIVAFSLALMVIGIKYSEAAVTMTLAPGDSGTAVSELQTFLSHDTSVYPEGLATGLYGELTTAAVQRFQCKYGIVCDGTFDTTGYGRVGPKTLAKIQSLQTPGVPNTGVVAPSPVSLPPVDESAPLTSNVMISVGSTTANFQWATNEPSENSVLYASFWPFYLGTASSVSSATFSTSANVTLTGLIPNHAYYFVRQSVDFSGNVQYGLGGVFTTIK